MSEAEGQTSPTMHNWMVFCARTPLKKLLYRVANIMDGFKGFQGQDEKNKQIIRNICALGLRKYSEFLLMQTDREHQYTYKQLKKAKERTNQELRAEIFRAAVA